MDGNCLELQQIKKDWYEKDPDIVNIHLYVRDVEEHEIIFEENQVIIRFATKHKSFLKLYIKDKKKTSFLYVIKTRKEINPSHCRFQIKTPFIELILEKKEAGKWGSLERFEINELDIKEQNCSPTKQNGKNNSQLLGGKSTPLTKKSSEDCRPESSVKIDNQQAGSSKTHDDQLNIKKASMTPSTQVQTLVGLTGLENYANNCYMNVVIQILANIYETRDFFKNDHFLKEINANNPLGSGGKVAKAFSEVAKALWSLRKSAFKPSALKSIMGKRCSLFLGWQQHDAQEFFASLLDNLHEDLNQYSSENTVEKETKPQAEGEASCNEKPDTAWAGHLKRNNSFITKLFHGQLMSKLTCAACNKTSYSYDPCAQVSLPIPSCKNIFNILLFTRDSGNQPLLITISVATQNAVVWHLTNMLQTVTKIPTQCLSLFNGYTDLCNDDRMPLLALQKQKYIAVSETISKEECEFLCLPVFQYVHTPSSFVKCDYCGTLQSEITTKLKRCTRCMVVAYCSRDCQSKHWQIHNKNCVKESKMQVGIPFFLVVRKENLNYELLEKAIREKANYTIEAVLRQLDTDTGKDADSNLPSSNKTNVLCTGSHEGNSQSTMNITNSQCVIKISHEVNINNEQCLSINKDNFSIEALSKAPCLILEWQNYSSDGTENAIDIRSRELPIHQVYDEHVYSSAAESEQCSLYDSVRLFMEPERLDEKECWNCPKCKSLQAAKKEMAISCPPCLLLLHLKRFTYGDYGQKINKAISYPQSNFDLSPFIAKETRSKFDYPHVYDLCGVITHRGTMRMGHYTCMVRMINQRDEEEVGWRLFDDDSVTKMKNEKVISPDAYVLVYRLRGTQEILKIDRHPLLCNPSAATSAENIALSTAKRKRADSVSKTTVADRKSTSGNSLNRSISRSCSTDMSDEYLKGRVECETPPLEIRRCTSALPPTGDVSDSTNLKSGSLPDVLQASTNKADNVRQQSVCSGSSVELYDGMTNMSLSEQDVKEDKDCFTTVDFGNNLGDSSLSNDGGSAGREMKKTASDIDENDLD